MKDQIIERADELAMEIYDKEFYDLTEDQKDKIFKQAEEDVIDNFVGQAERLEDR